MKKLPIKKTLILALFSSLFSYGMIYSQDVTDDTEDEVVTEEELQAEEELIDDELTLLDEEEELVAEAIVEEFLLQEAPIVDQQLELEADQQGTEIDQDDQLISLGMDLVNEMNEMEEGHRAEDQADLEELANLNEDIEAQGGEASAEDIMKANEITERMIDRANDRAEEAREQTNAALNILMDLTDLLTDQRNQQDTLEMASDINAEIAAFQSIGVLADLAARRETAEAARIAAFENRINASNRQVSSQNQTEIKQQLSQYQLNFLD